jgi:hypothetical protein
VTIEEEDEELEEVDDDDMDGDDDDDDDDDATVSDEDEDDESPASFAKGIPDGGYGEDEDCVNAEDESYLKHLAKLEKKQQEKRVKEELRRAGEIIDDDDEDVDDELIFTTSVDGMDCVAYFLGAMDAVNKRDPHIAATLMANLSAEDKSRVQEFIASRQQS